MCPACITTAAVIAATSSSGVGVLGFFAARFDWWRRLRRRNASEFTDATPKSRE